MIYVCILRIQSGPISNITNTCKNKSLTKLMVHNVDWLNIPWWRWWMWSSMGRPSWGRSPARGSTRSHCNAHPWSRDASPSAPSSPASPALGKNTDRSNTTVSEPAGCGIALVYSCLKFDQDQSPVGFMPQSRSHNSNPNLQNMFNDGRSNTVCNKSSYST